MTATPPRILVLKTGTTHAGTRRRYGDFDRWFLDALRGSGAHFDVRDVTAAPPPCLDRHDGVLVTGSPVGVYERPDWLDALENALREAAKSQRTPLLGVCFGAQALASALGGQVKRNPQGWEIGTIQVRRTPEGCADPLLGGDNEEALTFQATHQDFIETLPDEALVLAGNDTSPVQAFRVGARVWGVQFHPEATPAILEDLIRERRELLGPAYCSALEGLSPTPRGRELLMRFVQLGCTPPYSNAPETTVASGARRQG